MDPMDVIKRNFTYHRPTETQEEIYDNIRALGRNYAEAIESWCPNSREKSLAMTHLEETVMWANAAIARNS
jgi:hypothetical protein